MELLIEFFPIVFVTALILLFFYLFQEIRRQQQQRQPPRIKPIPYPINRAALPSARTHLEKKLLSMLAGDRTAAQRLVAHVRQRNPGQGEEWCWQKAIADLERDRH
jgi:hypothetical protein